MTTTASCGARTPYGSLSRYDGLAAVRVNELGAAILHDPAALPALGLPVPRRVPGNPSFLVKPR